MGERTWADYGIIIPTNRKPNARGEVKVRCPKCSKGPNDWPLCANVQTKTWLCHRDGYTGSLYYNSGYKLPQTWEVEALSDTGKQYLLNRKFNDAVIKKMGFATRHTTNQESGQQTEWLVYPMKRYDKLVNLMMRRVKSTPPLSPEAERDFPRSMFKKDCEPILCNIDCLIDKPKRLYWVEGVWDGAALEMVGITSWVSIPNGSPKVGTQNFEGRLRPIEAEYERLKDIEEHVLFLDNDGPGRTMMAALARRLGPKKCKLVDWPNDEWFGITGDGKEDFVKDANAALMYLGDDELKVLAFDKLYPYPLEGIYTKDQIHDAVFDEREMKPDALSGIQPLDEVWGIVRGYTHIITGPPGTGKSTCLLDITRRVVQNYSWTYTVFLAENLLRSFTRIVISQASGIPFWKLTSGEKADWSDWINKHFHIIVPSKINSLEKILALASDIYYQYGDQGLILDPWNRIESDRFEKKMSEVEYLRWGLNLFSAHMKEFNQAGFIVNHPSSLMDREGRIVQMLSYYKCNGGSEWGNMSDMIFATNVVQDGRTRKYGHLPHQINTLKIKEQPEYGQSGKQVDLWFNPDTKRYLSDKELQEFASLMQEDTSYAS